ncbi:MAG TPA: response regulator transcription factor [Bacillota bacterium]|nr:response regulator transcription factor [Bacillota bacterium]HPT87691.1 response regulator transcription factor [Bacillota bacterium]
MAKILIIEDELKIQQIVKAYLQKEGFEVLTASDGITGLEAVKTHVPDLIILDLMLPHLSGEELLTQIRQSSDVPIIILSAKSSEDERIFGLNIGADDYLVKPFSPRELVARVFAHLRRIKPKTAETPILSFNGQQLIIDDVKHEVFRNGEAVNLTPTEYKILLCLCRNPGQVFSRSQLVEKVQGYQYSGYDRTIDSHVKNLRQKIEPNPEEPRFILTVFGIGYKFGGERD